MRNIFVTGTDTGVGKTVITGLLARYLLGQGYAVITQKWVQTGCRGLMTSDVGRHLEIMGRREHDIKEYRDFVLPYAFRRACSPHLSCSLEHKTINAGKIINSYKVLSREFDCVIAEGAGGALVPYNTKRLLIDIAQKLALPALIVVQNKLGAVNHTLLTIEALRLRGIKILGIVFNNSPHEQRIVLEDNPRIVRLIGKENIFGALPWRNNCDSLYREFSPVGDRICRAIA